MRLQIKENQDSKIPVSFPLFAESSACGKAILAGEHAVVYGARAIAMPLIQLRMKVVLTSTGKEDSLFQVNGKDVSSEIRDVILDAFNLVNVEPFPFQIIGSTNFPIGAGLGSSATLCVITLRTIANALKLSLPVAQLATLANQLEGRFHGRPSGLDTAVVSHEKCLLFSKGAKVVPVPVAHVGSWRFALIDSEMRTSTARLVQQTSPYFHSKSGLKRIKSFDELSMKIAEGLTEGHIENVANSLNKVGDLLSEIGVVPSTVENIISICRSHGALAAKVTGAGGGGMILALLCPRRYQDQFRLLSEKFGRHRVFSVNL